MKTTDLLKAQKDNWDKYKAPGDSARLKKFVADKWKTSAALEHYADTYLPKSSVDLGPFVLLSAERIESANDWDDGELLSHFGLLEIGGTVSTSYLFMLIDTGQVFVLDVYDIPVEDMRDGLFESERLEDFEVDKWIAYCEENREIGMKGPQMFGSFAEFDEALLAWHQESDDSQ